MIFSTSTFPAMQQTVCGTGLAFVQSAGRLTSIKYRTKLGSIFTTVTGYQSNSVPENLISFEKFPPVRCFASQPRAVYQLQISNSGSPIIFVA